MNKSSLKKIIIAVKDQSRVRGYTHRFYTYPAGFSPVFVEAAIQSLTKNEWIKLTHLNSPASKIKNVIHTYELEKNDILLNLENKNYFCWMSSSAFKYAIHKYPNIKNKFHFCGPGNTYKEIKKILGDESQNLTVELSYKDWKNKILPLNN